MKLFPSSREGKGQGNCIRELVRFEGLLKCHDSFEALVQPTQTVACGEKERDTSLLEQMGHGKGLFIRQIDVQDREIERSRPSPFLTQRQGA